MRISSNLLFQTGLNSINAQQSDLLHLYEQIGSGKRMVTPADDPLAAAQAVNISQSQSLNTRFAANRAVATTNLATEENALNAMTLLLQDVKTQLVSAGNGTLSDTDRATLSNVLANARDSMLGLANSTDGSGQYLFSGAQGGTMPYQEVAGSIVYKGDSNQRKIQADQTRQIAGGDIGSDIFNRAAPGTTNYLTSPVGVHAGTGVMSTPTITDQAGSNIGNTFTIEFTSATTYDIVVTDPAGVQVGPLVSQTYDPNSPSPLSLPGGVQVTLSGAPQAGDTFKVESASASNTNLDIFATFDSIIKSLEQPIQASAQAQAAFQNSLNSAMQRLDVNYNNILTVRASVGSRMNELDAIGATGSARALSYSSQLSKLEDVDYYTATTQLQLRSTALEAASLAFKKIQSLGLFNTRS